MEIKHDNTKLDEYVNSALEQLYNNVEDWYGDKPEMKNITPEKVLTKQVEVKKDGNK